MILKTGGTVTRKETPPSEEPEGGVKRPIAGGGFEPPTSGLWARRATRLLYPAVIINQTYHQTVFSARRKPVIDAF